MSGISSIISTVDAKVAQVIHLGETLKTKLGYEEERNQKLLAELDNKNKHISQLEEQIRKLQTLENMPITGGNNPVKQDTKVKINELVREIDKCIALLNR